MLPIEEGCLAMVITNGHSTGITVEVGSFIGEIKGFTGNDRWLISKEIDSTRGIKHKHCREKYLMRIDGYKEETKQKAEVVRWK